MPLTLDEIKSLIGALGVKVPDAILAEKTRAEEFRTRQDKIIAEAGSKPADWRLKANFDQVIKNAAQAAGQKQFDAAFKLLDQAGLLLQQPDSIPTPPALLVWQEAKESVDAQLGQLYDKLKRVGLPVLEEAANQIEGVLAGYRTKLVTALTEYDQAAGSAKEEARTKALQVVSAYQTNIPNDKHIIAADTNPFGIQVAIRKTLGSALADLSKQLASS
jgi:hypothetical protein